MLLDRLSENSKKLFLALETLLVQVDGDFSEQEQRVLKQHCAEMQIEPLSDIHKLDLNEIVTNINSSMSVQEKKIILIELITVALVDGVYDEKEQEFVEYMRNILQIPMEVAKQAIDLVQKLVDTSTMIQNFVTW